MVVFVHTYRRGDNVLLYVRFLNAQSNVVPAQNPLVSINHLDNNLVVSDLVWTPLSTQDGYEYTYTWQVPSTALYGFYEVNYQGWVDGQLAQLVDEFHVVGSNEFGLGMLEIYGLVHQARTGHAVVNAEVTVYDTKLNVEVAHGYTDDGGMWKLMVYPSTLSFTFTKVNYAPVTMTVIVNADNQAIPFENVVLTPLNDSLAGTGIWTVSDRYTTKEGYDLYGMSVSATSLAHVGTPVASTLTDTKGKWELHLDPGTYLLHVSGTVFGATYAEAFYLNVDEDGTNTKNPLGHLVATIPPVTTLTQGNGTVAVTDEVYDAAGNSLIDVTVTASLPPLPIPVDNDATLLTAAAAVTIDPPDLGTSLIVLEPPLAPDTPVVNPPIAATTTNMLGQWTLYLNPGTYIISFTAPGWRTSTELRVVTPTL